MRKLLFVALLVLILAPMSVAALGSQTNVTPEGNVIQPMFGVDIYMQTPPPNWGLAFGENSWFTTPGQGPVPGPYPQGNVLLTITGHAMQGVIYSITASDKLDGGKPLATKGFLAEYKTAYSNVIPGPGGMQIPVGPLPGVVNITSQGWVPSGKVLVKPLRLTNNTHFAGPPILDIYKYYNMTGIDPMLFIGVGDTPPGMAPGPGTSMTFDINQVITLTDSSVLYQPHPMTWGPPVWPLVLYEQHSYKMPITITLTAL